MHDIQFNTVQNEMIGYPYTLTPPSSNEDSPQTINMHSPNHYIFQAVPNIQTQYIIPTGNQYDVSMTNLFTTEIKPPAYLSIVEQPIDKFRFRYKSEMAGTHGSLTGINSDKTRKQTYPTVKLNNFFEAEAIIRCSLYQFGSSDDRQPHAHRLIMKHGQEEKDDPHDLLITKDHNYEGSFHSMGIIHTAKKHIVGELKRKKTLLKMEENARIEKIKRPLTVKEEVEINTSADEECKSINLNIVCLRFDAFRRGEHGILYPICKPIYSHAINNLKSALTGELKIVRMDHSSSPAKGNREIFMLVEKVTKKNIKIRFFELDEDENEIWSEYGKFNDLDVHHQYAIVFRTPAYKELNIDEPRKVYIELERPTDGSRSEPREFTYTPSNSYKAGMKRPRTNLYSSSEYSSNSLNSAELPTTLVSVDQNIACEVSSADLQAALKNIDSEEFQKIYDIFGDSFVNGGTGPSLEYDSQKKTNSSQLSQDSSANNTDKQIMKRAFEEFQDFMKSNPKNEDILRMIQHVFTKYVNEVKENALHIAASEGNLRMVKNFLNIISTYYKNPKILNMRNDNGETAIHLALQNPANAEVITTLLKYQLDLSIKDNNGCTPLHVAIMKGQSPLVIDTLLRSPYGAELFVNAENNDSLTALHMAIKMNKPRYVELLYRHRADVNLIDKKTGFNSLHIAITEQAKEIVKLLLEKTNIDILKKDFRELTPLQTAKHLMQDKEPERIEIYKMIEQTMIERGLQPECVIKEEIESEEEMELDTVECKIEKLSLDDVAPIYKFVTNFTPVCLEEISRLLDKSENWRNLANLLDLEHFIHTDMFLNAKSKSKQLLQLAMRGNDLLTIRNFLENLGELQAISIMDRMVMATKMET